MLVFEVQISLAVRNLHLDANVDGLRASFHTLLNNENYFTEISQSETVLHETNVYFRHKCQLPFIFGRSKVVLIKLFGVQESTGLFHGEIGKIQFDLAEIATNNGKKSFNLVYDTVADVGIVLDEKYSSGIRLRLCGSHIHSPNQLPLASYYAVTLSDSNGTPYLVHKSEVIKDSKYPQWSAFVIPLHIFQMYQVSAITVQCYNYNVNAPDSVIGKFTTTLGQLHHGVGPLNCYMLVNELGVRIGDNTSIDVSLVEGCQVPTLFDKLSSGLVLPYTIAVDFTASNGNITKESSLHYIHPHSISHYESIMCQTLPPLLNFTNTSKIGAVGFGAKIEPTGALSQCFPMDSPGFVNGLNGLITAYRKTNLSIVPYAPTEYSEVIYHTSKFAKAESNRKIGLYFVMFIFTAGKLTKNKRTVDAIVDASYHPMSIVFITLDQASPEVKALESPLLKHSDGRQLHRQIVHVVPHTELETTTAFSLLPYDISCYYANSH